MEVKCPLQRRIITGVVPIGNRKPEKCWCRLTWIRGYAFWRDADLV